MRLSVSQTWLVVFPLWLLVSLAIAALVARAIGLKDR